MSNLILARSTSKEPTSREIYFKEASLIELCMDFGWGLIEIDRILIEFD